MITVNPDKPLANCDWPKRTDDTRIPIYKGVKHQGPGDHPGTGTPQSVHGGGGTAVAPNGDPIPESYRDLISDAIKYDVHVPLINNPHIRVAIEPDVAGRMTKKDFALMEKMIEEADSFNLPPVTVLRDIYFIGPSEMTLLTGSSTVLGAYSPTEQSIVIQFEGTRDDDYLAKDAIGVAREPIDVIAHEIGHAMHAAEPNNVFDRALAMRGSFSPNQLTDAKTHAMVARVVSKYASIMPVEFVAEVFSGIRRGNEYDGTIMEIYEDFGGPKPPSQRGK